MAPIFSNKEVTILGADETGSDWNSVQGDFGVRAQKGNLRLNASFMVSGSKDNTSGGGKVSQKYVF